MHVSHIKDAESAPSNENDMSLRLVNYYTVAWSRDVITMKFVLLLLFRTLRTGEYGTRVTGRP